MIEKIKNINEMTTKYPKLHLPKFNYPASHPLFIDIETTGFSSKKSMIYAIGCIYQKSGEYIFHQLFADSKYSEPELLIALEMILKANKIDLLVHFNGKNFDIPFLITRYQYYELPSTLGTYPQFDFYSQWKGLKKYFNTPNAKLKTLEKVLKLDRNDQMDGGQLIKVYHDYLYGQENLLYLLLLHNEEDLLATFLLGHFLPFLEESSFLHEIYPYFNQFPHVQKLENNTEIAFYNPEWQHYLEQNFNSTYFKPTIQNTYLQKYVFISAEMYHFFSDYKNYVYLPLEDTAIHQSVAQFVDSNHRQKATKKNAYIKKRDIYIEIPLSAIKFFSNYPLFQKNYQDKSRYLTLSDAKSCFLISQ